MAPRPSGEPAPPLAGLRVLDASQDIAGPYAAKLLLDLGAQVTKVEPPNGDRLRSWSPTGDRFDPAVDGGLFEYLNASKRSIVIDLGREIGRRQFREAATTADVIIEGNESPFLDERGLAFDDLRSLNPALSLVSISWFGRSGPFRDVPATDFTLQAWSGSIASRGPEALPPVQCGGRPSEWLGGPHAAAAALTAYRAAKRSGIGRRVDVSLFECAVISLVSYPTVFRSFSGTSEPGGRKLDIPSIHRAADGWVGVCIVTGQQWLDFLVMIGRSDLLEDRELATWPGRSRRADEVNGFVDEWMNGRSVSEILEDAESFRIPAAPIGNGETLLTFDHLQARNVFSASASGTFLQPRAPIHIAGIDSTVPTQAPSLGEHGDDVWNEREPTLVRTSASNGADVDAPLAGVRILDLTAFVAGPMATLFLASFGADVVKIESVQRPDPIRYYSVSTPDDPDWYEKSPYFTATNLGKRSVTLDLSDDRGMRLLHELVADSDVVIENFTPRVMDQFGLDYELIRRLNPSAILVRLPAFGLDGPWRDRGGFAQTIEQVSGLAWVTGHGDGPPLVPGGMCDPLQAIHAAVGVLAALEHRESIGRGFEVEIPMVEVALNITAEQVIEWSRNTRLLTRAGNRGPVAAPQGLYECRDRSLLALAVVSDEQWLALATVLGSPDWAGEPKLLRMAERRANHDLIDLRLCDAFASVDRDAVLERLLAAGVPAAPVLPGGLLEEHPQLQSREFFQRVDQPIVGRHGFPGWPYGVDTWDRPWFAGPAPLLGEHTRAVLHDRLGLDDSALDELERASVIGRRPRGSS